MNKKKLIVSIAVWALAVLLTLLIFFVVFDDYSKIRVTALIFILIALTVTLGVVISNDFIGKKTERLMFNAGIFTFVSIYLTGTMLVSLIFMLVNKGGKWLGLLNGILLILFAMAFIVLFYFSNVIGAKNRKVLAAAGQVKGLEIAIQTLKNNPSNKEFYARLDKLYEAAKYCDCTVFCEKDEKIQSKLTDLEIMLDERNAEAQTSISEEPASEASVNSEEIKAKINKHIDDMLLLYKARGEEVKQSKGGGF